MSAEQLALDASGFPTSDEEAEPVSSLVRLTCGHPLDATTERHRFGWRCGDCGLSSYDYGDGRLAWADPEGRWHPEPRPGTEA